MKDIIKNHPGYKQANGDDRPRTRFVKDTGIPILHTWDADKFVNYVLLYDTIHGSVQRFVDYMNAIEGLGVDRFFQARARFIDDMKDAIANAEVVKAFKDNKINNVKPPVVHATNKRMYSGEESKSYMSIDIRTGNFTAIQQMAEAHGLEGLRAANYEALAAQHTDQAFLVQSKQIRQLIFGQVIGNGVAATQLRMTEGLAAAIHDRDVYRMGPDEIYTEIEREQVGQQPSEILGFDVDESLFHARTFTVDRVAGSHYKHYVKRDKHGSITALCCVSRLLYAQTFKHVFGLHLDDFDLEFDNDGLLARFVEPLYKED